MTPDQFRIVVLAWIGALAFVVPVGATLLILVLKNASQVADAWRELSGQGKTLDSHTTSIAGHETRLNGELDARIAGAIAAAAPAPGALPVLPVQSVQVVLQPPAPADGVPGA